MNKVALGAAVAAGVMLCGWMGAAEKAEAASIYNVNVLVSIGFEGSDFNIPPNEDYGSFSLSSSARTSALGDFEVHFGQNGYLNGYFDSTADTVTFYGGFFSKAIAYGDVQGIADVFAGVSGGLATFNGTQGTGREYSGSGQSIFMFTVEGGFGGFTEDEQSGVQADFTISAVPLPSSAPLFGVALIALGGLTYVRRRGKPITRPA